MAYKPANMDASITLQSVSWRTYMKNLSIYIGLKQQSLEIDQSALECNYNVNNQIMSW